MGSRLIAQKFTRAALLLVASSAVDYNATAAARQQQVADEPRPHGERATKLVGTYHATSARPIPANLVAASGGGLDPDITLEAARYQAERVAQARGLPLARASRRFSIDAQAFSPGGPLTPDRIANVLELNLALDSLPK